MLIEASEMFSSTDILTDRDQSEEEDHRCNSFII